MRDLGSMVPNTGSQQPAGVVVGDHQQVALPQVVRRSHRRRSGAAPASRSTGAGRAATTRTTMPDTDRQAMRSGTATTERVAWQTRLPVVQTSAGLS